MFTNNDKKTSPLKTRNTSILEFMITLVKRKKKFRKAFFIKTCTLQVQYLHFVFHTKTRGPRGPVVLYWFIYYGQIQGQIIHFQE